MATRRLKTAKGQEYAIKTFAIRGKLLEWLEAQEEMDSKIIRRALTEYMIKEKRRVEREERNREIDALNE